MRTSEGEDRIQSLCGLREMEMRRGPLWWLLFSEDTVLAMAGVVDA